MPRRPPVQILNINDPKPKAKKPEGPPPEKVCALCGEKYTVDDFYPNRNETTGLRRDKWCKKCYKKNVVDMDTLRKYMFDNGRLWTDALWEECQSRAEKEINASPEYATVVDEEIRKAIILTKTLAIIPTVMNQTKFYRHFDPSLIADNVVDVKKIEESRKLAREIDDPYDRVPIYSKKWGGRYTQAEIDQMDEYYDSIIKTRGIDDSIAERYAKQFVKQTVMVDKFAEEMRKDPSKEKTSQYKEAVAALEVLSQAAQLAPRYRKTESSYSVSSLSEFIRAMEYGKMLMHEPEFAPDQIDGMMANLRHLAAAMDGSGGLWDKDSDGVDDRRAE